MALTKVSGGILDPGINVAGIVTATGFDGPFTGGSSKNITAGIITATGFDLNGNGDISGNLVIGGNLTANGDFTTLNTTLREVEILRVDANSSAIAGIITQSGSGYGLYVDGTTVLGNTQLLPSLGAGTKAVAADLSGNGNWVDFTIFGGRSGRSILNFGDHDDQDAGAIKYYHSDNSLNFTTNGSATERLTITSDGNVGINSTIPAAKLDVNGTSKFQDDVTFLTDTGKNIVIDKSANKIIFGDNVLGAFGSDSDLLIHHTGSTGYIKNQTGNFYIQNDGVIIIGDQSNSTTGFKFQNGGAVELYHNNLKTAFTDVDQWIVYGRTANSGMVEIASNQGANNNDRFRIHKTSAASRLSIQNYSTGSWVENIRINAGGAVELKHADGTTKFQTTSTGAKLPISSGGDGLEFFNSGDIYPEIIGNMNRTLGDKFLLSLVGKWNNNHSVAKIVIKTGDDTTNKDDGRISFFTAQSGGTLLERLEITPFGHVNVLGDSKKLQIGAGQDLQLYHDTNNSFIENSTGQLSLNNSGGNVTIRASDSNADFILRVGGSTSSENAIVAVHHGEVVLSCNGETKLTTTNTGITVTGEVAASQDYPNFRPTLDFNFAAEKKLNPRITYFRSGPASFVNEFGKIIIVGDNAPRFDHDIVTRESKGLLIEEARTNLAKYSDMDMDSIGASYYSNVTLSRAEGPDGVADSALQVTFNAAGGSFVRSGLIPCSAGVEYTFSVWIKKVSGSFNNSFFSYPQNASAGLFNNSGFVNTEGQSLSAMPTGVWKRFTQTRTTASGTTAMDFVMPGYDSNGATIQYYGLQMEAGAFATSYIPSTNGAATTRGYEAVTLEGTEFSDVFGTDFKEFSLVADYDNTQTNDGTNYGIIDLWGESTGYNDRIEWFKDDGNSYHIETRSFGQGNATFANGNLSASSKAKSQRFATSWYVPDYSNTSSRRFVVSMGGEAVDVIGDSSGTTVPQITRMGIGCNPTRLDFSPGLLHFKRLMVYNKTLSDGQLQNLSAQ